jgi:hypothetical protein
MPPRALSLRMLSVRSTLDYFKLSMHVEMTTNLAKLSKEN